MLPSLIDGAGFFAGTAFNVVISHSDLSPQPEVRPAPIHRSLSVVPDRWKAKVEATTESGFLMRRKVHSTEDCFSERVFHNIYETNEP